MFRLVHLKKRVWAEGDRDQQFADGGQKRARRVAKALPPSAPPRVGPSHVPSSPLHGQCGVSGSLVEYFVDALLWPCCLELKVRQASLAIPLPFHPLIFS